MPGDDLFRVTNPFTVISVGIAVCGQCYFELEFFSMISKVFCYPIKWHLVYFLH